jgi:uncharacterized membrane protein YkoI
MTAIIRTAIVVLFILLSVAKSIAKRYGKMNKITQAILLACVIVFIAAFAATAVSAIKNETKLLSAIAELIADDDDNDDGCEAVTKKQLSREQAKRSPAKKRLQMVAVFGRPVRAQELYQSHPPFFRGGGVFFLPFFPLFL